MAAAAFLALASSSCAAVRWSCTSCQGVLCVQLYSVSTATVFALQRATIHQVPRTCTASPLATLWRP
ncbi:hypothetical protein ACFPRL_36430 [Pseudoclavibacter helvolus]